MTSGWFIATFMMFLAGFKMEIINNKAYLVFSCTLLFIFANILLLFIVFTFMCLYCKLGCLFYIAALLFRSYLLLFLFILVLSKTVIIHPSEDRRQVIVMNKFFCHYSWSNVKVWYMLTVFIWVVSAFVEILKSCIALIRLWTKCACVCVFFEIHKTGIWL